MAAPVGWGIVGYGWVARDYMAPGIRAAGHRLVAVCDPGAEPRAAAEAQGARAHADLAGLIAEPEVEAVYVATPNHLHRGAVEALAAAGKAVLCEKPMAASLADAEAMAGAVARTGILYGTAFDQRHHPAHRALRDAIRAGRIGTATAIRIVYACWLDRAWTSVPGQPNWRIDPAQAGGGALMDLAPHGLDLIEFLLGEPILDIAALTQCRAQGYAVDDGAQIIGRTASGVLASLHVAYNYPDALPRRRLEVSGTGGVLVAENTMGQDPGGRATWISGRDGTAEDIAFDGHASPFLEQVRAFGRALREPAEREAWSAARDLHTMRLLARAYEGA
ncbi:Gfo/Idh/MocA family protein [Methylobacterium oryzihabitans]|uniref:Gfo/Idh/MocA family oxidoreductase n=1 Tax=Methylobacterium oryzihabitans TaxID=2499852 RepID=A0A437P0N1_9HYPH|nr:Gfo/Idh/MocA family oxidoreductase [Methylobacterium oryzihabitans]RVU15830.1 Gfo/Idh/MocA family oxidoreductase [Methylobacterium oryzihabitans]